MGRNSLLQYSWRGLHYPLHVLLVSPPCKDELVAPPAFCIWHTWIWCCGMHFVVQQPKIVVEPGFSRTLFPHGGYLHACLNIRTTAGCFAEGRIGCFTSSLIVALPNRPLNRIVLSLSTNGESFAKSCFTFSPLWSSTLAINSTKLSRWVIFKSNNSDFCLPNEVTMPRCFD